MDSANRSGAEKRQAHRGCRRRASFLRSAQRDRAIATARLRHRAIVGLALGSARVSRAGERVLAIANFSSDAFMFTPARSRRLFRRDAAVTDAKQRPGFPTNTRDACAYPDSRSRFNGIVS